MHKHLWRQANIKLLPCVLLIATGLVLSYSHGGVRKGSLDHQLLAFIGVVIFMLFSVSFLHILTEAVRKTIVYKRLGTGRAAALQFILRLIGYLTVLIVALDRLGVPVGHILVGSAVLGIILGVAAQQALANFFASIILIISHPFAVGDEVALVSGALGGRYEGTIIDIGLTHTKLKEKNESLVSLPNSTLLTSAAIVSSKKQEQAAKAEANEHSVDK